ncbi:hypothetical protein ACLB2K_003463 [Fragaria x ananassa]
MSFVFPKPSYSKPRNSSSSVFDQDDNHYKLLWHPEPDYDELLIRLSLFAFNRLSPSDQRKQVAKISRTVNIHVRFLEKSDEASRLATFAELFKKLPFSDQLKVFLSEVIQKLKRESQGMTSRWDWKSYFGKVFSATWLQDQSTGDQDMHNEQLSDGDTAVVAEKCEETSTKNEISSNWTSSFGEFFLGFSVGVETERPLAAAAEDLTSTPDHEEAMRIRRLTELFNQVPVPTRIALFKELRTTLLVHKRYSEAVSVFRGLGSKSQTEIIEYMLYEITAGTELTVAIVVKFSGETMIWFKANSANIRRNPVQIILFGKVEIGDTIEKLPEESEEDYKLRRFEESFKQLEFTSQKRVLDYIQDTISADLGYPEPETIPCSADTPSEGRGLFDPDWINYRPTNPRILVAATTQAGTATLGDK